MSFWVALGAAFWFGIQTSISPCPLATNIAAVSFIARGLGQTRRVLLSGVLYAAGRALAYVGLAVLLLSLLGEHLTAGSEMSRFFLKYGGMAIGPLLILIGMLLLGLIGSGISFSFGGSAVQQRAAKGGLVWAFLLGILFALTFCPVSAGLFFFCLVPLAASQQSLLALPTLYGVGTAVPVIVFAFVMAFAGQYVGKAFNRLTQVERWVRWVTGLLFILVGIYYSLVHIFGIQLV